MVKSIILTLILVIIAGCDFTEREYAEEEITFINSHDGIKLSGTLTYPVKMKNTAPAVVLVHDSGPSDRDLDIASGTGLFRKLARFFASHGIISLRYDKRGVGKSEGNYVSYDLDNFAEDGIAAVEFLEEQPKVCNDCIGAIGLSQGGLVVPIMQLEHPSINFIVLMATPGTWDKEFFLQSHYALAEISDTSSPEAQKNKFLMDELWTILNSDSLSSSKKETGKNILHEMWSYVNNIERRTLGYTEMNLNKWIDEFTEPTIRKWYKYNHQNSLSLLRCPVLAITGDKDRQTPSGYNLSKIEKAFNISGKSNYKIIELNNVNHIFQNCVTGLPSEYTRIGNDLSVDGFSKIVTWINNLECRKP